MLFCGFGDGWMIELISWADLGKGRRKRESVCVC